MVELTDRSVVAPAVEQGSVSGSFFMTYVQRVHARRKLSQTGRAEQAALRHAQYFSTSFSGFRVWAGEGDAHDVFHRVHRDIGTALRWSLDHQPDLALNLGSALAAWLCSWGRTPEVNGLIESVLAVNTDRTAERAEALAWGEGKI